MSEIFMDDWLIENAVDQGLPLNSVVADGVFVNGPIAPYEGKILVTPLPHAGTAGEAALEKALKAGLRVLTYGNPQYASRRVRGLLGLEEAGEIEGEMEIETGLLKDIARDLPLPTRLRHDSLVSNGGIGEIPGESAQGVEYLAFVRQGGERRVYAALNPNALGGVLGVRAASFPTREQPGACPPTGQGALFPGGRAAEGHVGKAGPDHSLWRPSSSERSAGTAYFDV